MTKKQALIRPLSILDHAQAEADAVSTLLRTPAGEELIAKKRTPARQTAWDDELDALLRRTAYENERKRIQAEREERKRSSPTTMAPSLPPSEAPNRTLRRRHSKYPWNEICGEIAARCIDPKTRCVDVPKNENRLAEDMLEQCAKTGREPPLSDMREAVNAICARLRKI
jgi:hypothetical protein